MKPRTRAQILELNRAFYAAHAEAFDRSRGARAWPGWARLVQALRAESGGWNERGAVLDVGCGNGRFACFLAQTGFSGRYVGVDANSELLAAAGRQIPAGLAPASTLRRLDFLAPPAPGASLPAGPFDLIVLMGILHHVPGADWRLALLRAAAARLAPGGCLALAVWRFADDPREGRRRVPIESLGPILGHRLDPADLEPGDSLLRFGDDADRPPRYCHAVDDAELEAWPGQLRLGLLADFRADGARGDANRYALMRRPPA